jgi:hypothetical protein
MPIVLVLAMIALAAGGLAALTMATFVLGGLLSVVAGFVILGTAAQFTGGDSVMLLFGILAVLLGVRVMMKVVQGEAPLQKPDVHGTAAPHSASLSTAASSGTSGTRSQRDRKEVASQIWIWTRRDKAISG